MVMFYRAVESLTQITLIITLLRAIRENDGFYRWLVNRIAWWKEQLSKTENKYKKHNQYLKMKWYIYMKISQCLKVKFWKQVNLLEWKSWIKFLNLPFVKVNWLIELNFLIGNCKSVLIDWNRK